MAVTPEGKGDMTKTRLKWKINRVPEGFSSPLIVGEHLYRLCNPEVLKCWKLATGEEVYTKRLQGVTTAAVRSAHRTGGSTWPRRAELCGQGGAGGGGAGGE